MNVSAEVMDCAVLRMGYENKKSTMEIQHFMNDSFGHQIKVIKI